MSSTQSKAASIGLASYPADRVGPNATKTYRIFERFNDRKTAASRAHQQKQEALRADKALLQRELREELDGRLPRIDDQRVAFLKESIADIDGQIRANDEAFAADPLNGIVGLNQIDEGLRAQQGRRLKDKNTTDTAIDGKSAEEMHELRGNQIVQYDCEVEGLWLRPVSREAIEARIIKNVNDLTSGSINVESVKYVRPRGIRGRPLQGSVKFPVTFSDGKEVVDLAAVLLSAPAIRTLLIDFLVEKALADHDEAHAMTPMQREQAVAAAREAQREARYKCAFWYRKLIDQGRYVPPRTTDALALLDVE